MHSKSKQIKIISELFFKSLWLEYSQRLSLQVLYDEYFYEGEKQRALDMNTVLACRGDSKF